MNNKWKEMILWLLIYNGSLLGVYFFINKLIPYDGYDDLKMSILICWFIGIITGRILVIIDDFRDDSEDGELPAFSYNGVKK